MRRGTFRSTWIWAAVTILAAKAGACGGTSDSASTMSQGGASQASSGVGGSSLTCEPGSTVNCYSGPQGTKDIGICKSGTQTCNPEGTSYGPCVGEVTPQSEDCTKPEDEDCNGIVCSECLWSILAGDISGQATSGIGTDSNGNAYITGWFDGTFSVGGEPLISSGTADVFVMKLDPAGKLRWQRRFGGADFERTTGIAVDANGNSIIYGGHTGQFTLDSFTITAPSTNNEAFVAKLDTSGNVMWATAVNGVPDAEAIGGSFDSQGNVVIAGESNVQNPYPASPGIFVQKLTANGQQIWLDAYDTPSREAPNAIAVDAADNIYFAGVFSNSTTIGSWTLTSSGLSDIFVAKLDPSGAVAWAKRFGGSNDDVARALTCDSAGNILMTGEFHSTLDFGGPTLVPAGGADAYVVKLNPAGLFIWSKQFGDASDQIPLGIAIDSDGNLLLTGIFTGTIDFGGEVLTSAGQDDVFLAKLDPNAQPLWSKRFGDAGYQVPDALSVTSDGAKDVLLAGGLRGSVDFGDGEHTGASPDTPDMFVAKFAP